MKRSLVCAAALGALVVGVSAVAGASEHASATLVYDAPTSCPLATDLSRAVSERLGYDPFVSGAEKVVRVRITTAPGGKRFRAHIDVRAQGAPQGERDIPEESDCAEVVRAASLMVALAVDPLADGRPTHPAPSAPPVPTPPSPPPSAAPVASTPPREPPPAPPAAPAEELRFHLQAGAMVSALRLPMAGAGFVVQLGIARETWSIAVEGRAEFPFASLDVPGSPATPTGGSVTASLLSLMVVPCIERRYYFGCALFESGVLRGTGGDVKTPKQDASPTFSVGARFGAQLVTDDRFLFRAYVEALAPLTRTTLFLNNAAAWSTPTLGLGFGLAMGRRF